MLSRLYGYFGSSPSNQQEPPESPADVEQPGGPQAPAETPNPIIKELTHLTSSTGILCLQAKQLAVIACPSVPVIGQALGVACSLSFGVGTAIKLWTNPPAEPLAKIASGIYTVGSALFLSSNVAGLIGASTILTGGLSLAGLAALAASAGITASQMTTQTPLSARVTVGSLLTALGGLGASTLNNMAGGPDLVSVVSSALGMAAGSIYALSPAVGSLITSSGNNATQTSDNSAEPQVEASAIDMPSDR